MALFREKGLNFCAKKNRRDYELGVRQIRKSEFFQSSTVNKPNFYRNMFSQHETFCPMKPNADQWPKFPHRNVNVTGRELTQKETIQMHRSCATEEPALSNHFSLREFHFARDEGTKI